MFFKLIYLVLTERERERESTSRGGAERSDRIPSRLHAIRAEPDVGLEPMNYEIMT